MATVTAPDEQPPALSLATTTTNSHSSQSITEPALPITPEALLKHVRQMRIAASSRRTEPTTTIHSRAGSNASSNYNDELSTLCLSSSTISTCSNDGHSNPANDTRHPTPSSLTLTIPEPRPAALAEPSRTVAETLDLSHQRIADLTQPVVEELAEYVERLALGYNYLPILPDHFAILGESLRYLNLRGNHMEIFPEVLTRMPSLEILDVSRNKIKAFPRRPGSLDRLRVLSVSRNRIKRLPNYVANLTTLRVLKIDHNPVIWPPKELVSFVDACERADEDEADPSQRARDDRSAHVRTRTPSSETSASMTQWLRTLQDWMRKNPYVRPVKQTRPSTSETLGDPSEFGALRSTLDFERSFHNFKGAQSPDISPVMTLSSGGPGTSPVTNPVQQSSRSTKAYDHMVQHNRNASSSSSTQWVRKRPELRLKKSLPDLRRNHAEIMVERSADVERAYFGLNRSAHMLPSQPNSGSSVTFSLNSPGLVDRGPRSAMALSSGTSTPGLTTNNNNNPPPSSSQVSFNHSDLVSGRSGGGSQIRRIKIGASADEDSLSGDRNSGAYFRRLSMLPASTISKQVPTPLLQLIDGIRGILFSLSQIYAALKQFVMFATQDRLPGALSRMTSAADDSMGKLINALDRFDSSTRRAQPELEVVQQVFKSCRDNVIVFGKLVNVLSIQLKVLTASADVRYSRTLLLSLYGATAEIAMSWQTITPLVDDVISLPSLRKSKPPPPPPPLHESNEESSPSSDFQKASSASELRRKISRDTMMEPDQHESSTSKTILNCSSSSAAPTPTNHILPSATGQTSTKGRRHAGSFIAEDVQLGAYISAGPPPLPMPSYASFPPSPSPPNDAFGAKSNSAFSDEPRRMQRAQIDPLALGPPSLDPSSKDVLYPSLHSPSLPRSPALTSIASLSSSGPSPFVSDPTTTTSSSSSLLDNDLPRPLPPTAKSTPTSIVDIPERTTSRLHHPRFDGSLSRTDQDFLDMTEATIDIALSVTSLMLETLRQSSLTSADTLDPSSSKSEAGPSSTSTASVSGRKERKNTSAGVALSKPAELKELCEAEIEVIRRLRASLAAFWAARAAAASSSAPALRPHHHPHDPHNQPSKDATSIASSSSSSLASFASSSSSSNCSTASAFGSSVTATSPDFGGSNSSLGHHHHQHHHPHQQQYNQQYQQQQHYQQHHPQQQQLYHHQQQYQQQYQGGDSGLAAGSLESRKVFDDATAFVRAVIQTANLARSTMLEYPLSKSIREGLGELTKATKELATLLAVSSFKPGTTASSSSSSVNISSGFHGLGTGTPTVAAFPAPNPAHEPAGNPGPSGNTGTGAAGSASLDAYQFH
ncbi:hypothetical protein PTTG_09120 [Puccinia triticina 1-1 BBBD Race 1]|uniref:RAM signaling network component n=2 Tax=Puccinia triticina TaxID=208348 RepID=A0A180GT21_PUCT1|nr:uncharacterized protein PtA15_10A280 [Puccinia triticina]OAV95957.1 hypothetical protein PTTG_09120 [Puccinia triticina 1-1 BBBD Race 1]WAQ88859.1 hypothetical protein PtA15_10A280 [Puccinia triticina]WAR58917.1 hypothetical protein PtB15_10B257 [Puccinia triticina]